MKKYTLDFVKSTISNMGIEPLFDSYKNANEKLKVKCPKHGVFYKSFAKFLQSKKIGTNGCEKCGIDNQKKGLLYAIELTVSLGYIPHFKTYKNCYQKIKIECPKHGIFQTDLRTLERQRDKKLSTACTKCREENKLNIVLSSVKQLGLIPHFTSYRNNKEKLKVECPTHGIFYITYSNIQILIKKNGLGNGCRKCDIERKTTLSLQEKEERRKYPEYYTWRNKVFERDNYVCQKCNSKGGSLNAHHINNYSSDKDNRTNIDNGVTLCKKCHRSFHKKYGYKNNNIKQLEDFLMKNLE